MFGRSKFGSGRGYSFNNSKHTFGKRRHANWIFLNRKKHNKPHHVKKVEEEGSVVMTRDLPIIESISPISYDISDNTRPGNSLISTSGGKSQDDDVTDAIELQAKDSKINGEHNGLNHKFKNRNYKEHNDCCVKCVYFTQQCCECVIL